MTDRTPEQVMAEIIAGQIAYWWRMAETDDIHDPRSENSYWQTASRLAAKEVLRHEEGTDGP